MSRDIRVKFGGARSFVLPAPEARNLLASAGFTVTSERMIKHTNGTRTLVRTWSNHTPDTVVTREKIA